MLTKLFQCLSRLPLIILHGLGLIAGWSTWLLSGTYRRHLAENMATALGTSLARQEQAKAIASAGKTMLELPAVWMRPQSEALQLIKKVNGWEWVEAAQQNGQGIVFLTPHLGCYEITGHFIASKIPLTALYRPPKNRHLQEVLEKGRNRGHLSIAPADLSGVRTLLKALKRGEATGILPDQVPQTGEGRWLTFFNKPAYTMTLAARLTESKATPLFIWAERLPHGQGFHIHVTPPNAPIIGSTEERAQCINDEIERLIKSHPSQYLWGYNRYKRPKGAPPAPIMHKE